MSTAVERPPAGRINIVLVAAGEYHDIDFARLELLKLLVEDDRFRVRVFEDYENRDAIAAADMLVSYTCNVVPSLGAQQFLRDWLTQGGRWFALHGTNSILDMQPGGEVCDTPDWAPLFSETLGTSFRAHPAIGPYRVHVCQPEHPLVAGIDAFDVNDELYLSAVHGKLDVLLDAEFAGETPGFVPLERPRGRYPVFYRHPVGEGAVLYLTLGHCRGHYDLQPLAKFWPSVDRCAWEMPVYYELLRRGLKWGIEPVDGATAAERARYRAKHGLA